MTSPLTLAADAFQGAVLGMQTSGGNARREHVRALIELARHQDLGGWARHALRQAGVLADRCDVAPAVERWERKGGES